MTVAQQNLLKDIKEAGYNGVSAAELAEKNKLSIRSVWAQFRGSEKAKRESFTLT